MPFQYEEVTVRIPKAVMDFLRDFEKDPKAYIERRILDDVECDLDSLNQAEVSSIRKKKVIEKYGLEAVFKI